MNILFKNNIFWYVIAATIVLGGLYYFGNAQTSITQSTDSNSQTSSTQHIVDTLSQMQRVHVDTSVLSTPVWQSLHDITSPLPLDVPGRTDLFGTAVVVPPLRPISLIRTIPKRTTTTRR